MCTCEGSPPIYTRAARGPEDPFAGMAKTEGLTAERTGQPTGLPAALDTGCPRPDHPLWGSCDGGRPSKGPGASLRSFFCPPSSGERSRCVLCGTRVDLGIYNRASCGIVPLIQNVEPLTRGVERLDGFVVGAAAVQQPGQ